jgi:hypothetical protein
MMVTVILTVGGFSGLIWCLIVLSRSIDSENWIRVDCQITESTVEEIIGEGTEYRAVVQYRYSIDGRSYKGDTVRFGRQTSGKTYAYTICKKYPKGSMKRVSIDAENPQNSVLIPGISPSIYWTVIISIIFLAVGIGTIIAEMIK